MNKLKNSWSGNDKDRHREVHYEANDVILQHSRLSRLDTVKS